MKRKLVNSFLQQFKSEKKKKMMRTFCFAAPKADRKNMISFHPVAAVSRWGEILFEKA